MTQYCQSTRNIAGKPWMAVLFVICCGWPAGHAHAQAPDYVQYREATHDWFNAKSRGPVAMESAAVDGKTVRWNLTVQPSFAEQQLDLVLAVPGAKVTSGVMHVKTTDEPVSLGEHDTATTAGVSFASQYNVTVKPLGWVRGTRIVRVQTHAVVPGSFGKRLRTGELELLFETEPVVSAADGARAGAEQQGDLAEMISALVANPADVGRFATALAEVPQRTDTNGVALGGYPDALARFTVDAAGLVGFSADDLRLNDQPLTREQLDRVSVWTDDAEVPLFVQPAVAGGSAAAERFVLYATDNDSTYTRQRCYWVRLKDDGAPLRITAPDAPTAAEATSADAWFYDEAVIEKDFSPVLTRNDQFLTILDYRWCWWTWTSSPDSGAVPQPHGYEEPGRVTFDLPGLAAAETSLTMNLHFYPHHWKPTDTSVTLQVQLNGNVSDTISVPSDPKVVQPFMVSASHLKETGNVLTLTPLLDGVTTATLPDLCFDRVELTYPRRFEMTSHTLEFQSPAQDRYISVTVQPGITTTPITVLPIAAQAQAAAHLPTAAHPDSPNRIVTQGAPEDQRWIAFTSDAVRTAGLSQIRREAPLRSAQHRADLVVIAHRDFLEGIGPWIDEKVAEGHAVKLVDVQQIYDEFGYGHLSPHAIRAFLRYAAVHWQGSDQGPPASSVLLVGDSTSAYRDEFRNEVVNYVPTMRLTSSNESFASDQWFVSYFGDDHFADALIGRFSVNNTDDLRAIVQKQLHYKSRSENGPWKNRLGFIADHSEFEETVGRVVQSYIPPRFFQDQVILSELPWIDNYYFPKEVADQRQAKISNAATRRIHNMLSTGVSVVTYFGHGSPNIWSSERMWFGGNSPNSDNLLLTNLDRLPVVINMTCNSGAIDYPQPAWNICISEDFMRVPAGGAVACFVPSGPGLTVQHERLMKHLSHYLFGDSDRTLGQDTQLALWRYLADGNSPDLALMFILLGDPHLRPHIARPMPTDAAAPADAHQWPGTIALPADVAQRKTGGHYQFTRYDDTMKPLAVQPFNETAVALPLPADLTSTAPYGLAVSQHGVNGTSHTYSTVAPVRNLASVKLVQWKQGDSGPANNEAELEFQLRNTLPLPVQNLRVALLDGDRAVLGESDTISLLPNQDARVAVAVPVAAGLTTLTAELRSGTERAALLTENPIAAVRVRRDDERDAIAPAMADARSVNVKMTSASESLQATVSAQVYITAQEALSNLRVGLEGPDGVVVPSSIVTVPPVAPGSSTRVSMNVPLAVDSGIASYKLRFDPAGFFPEFARFPALSIPLGSDLLPDLLITSVAPTDASPTDGETVFFDVTVANAGGTTMDGVKVTGELLRTNGQSEALKSRVSREAPLLKLAPGEARVTRLRWDPFDNAGANNLRFTVSSAYQAPEKSTDNNTKDFTLKARTKARLRAVNVGVVRPTAEELTTNRIRFEAQFINEGETDAGGLRALFYTSKAMRPQDFAGEVDVDMIRAGETKRVQFSHQVKPGEEDKDINVTVEVMYKGSRQRLMAF